MKCVQCGNSLDYDKHRLNVYTIRLKKVAIGITCRFCGWRHYKKKKPIVPKTEELIGEIIDDAEYT